MSRRWLAAVLLVAAAVLAMLDVAEPIHGLRASEPFIGVLALIIAARHAAAVIAYRIASEPASLDSPVPPSNLSR